jgi:hypothetical protein
MIKVQPINARWRFLVDRIESGIARNYTTRHDQDANGTVERSEFSGNGDTFEQIDRNRNDRLELSELKRYVDLLRQHEPIRDSEGTGRTVQPEKGRSFSVSSHAKLTESMRDYFCEEVENLDKNANGLLETDEFVGTMEEFSAIDQDQNSLIGPREWTEGFVENHTEIQMVLKAYRFSHGIFQSRGGIIQMTV